MLRFPNQLFAIFRNFHIWPRLAKCSLITPWLHRVRKQTRHLALHLLRNVLVRREPKCPWNTWCHSGHLRRRGRGAEFNKARLACVFSTNNQSFSAAKIQGEFWRNNLYESQIHLVFIFSVYLSSGLCAVIFILTYRACNHVCRRSLYSYIV